MGMIVMGIAIPVMLFFLLGLHTLSQLLTIAAVTFIAWGVCDVLSTILERPRLKIARPDGQFGKTGTGARASRSLELSALRRDGRERGARES